MRCHVDLAGFGHEILSIKAFIAGQRDLLRSVSMRFYQVPRGQTLRMARGMCGNSIDNQTAAVFHQRKPHEGQLGFLAAPLAIKPCIGIGVRCMGLVAALLAVEVLLPIAARAGRRARAVLRPEAFGAGPGFQQRAINREMLA